MTTINPYQSPAEIPDASARSPDEARIIRNIRAICILYIVFGSMAVLGGIGLFFDESGDIPLITPCLMVGLGAGGIMSAAGVLRRRSWGISICQVLSALYVFSFPIGTILGGYFLVNIGKVKDAFREQSRPPQ